MCRRSPVVRPRLPPRVLFDLQAGRYGLINYDRRVGLDPHPRTTRNPPHSSIPRTWIRRRRDAPSFSQTTTSSIPQSLQHSHTPSTHSSTLELVSPEGTLTRFTCQFQNLGNLSMIKHSEWGAKSALHYESSPSFRGVFT